MAEKTISVEIVESAAADLEDILDWYREELVPDVGIELVKKVRKRLTQLQSFPEIGREVPEFNDPTIRELIEPPFRIVYHFDGEIASVVKVWRSERLMKDL
ncbi:MAG: type II toxin-antitoxin system RelE/ParE family toxin [Coriobacteriia bacterium]|nr:type II toxin-antitoxin system RelE/ParE family toxin [Coriobacteriia bacterium]MCL2745513.1 type II toxin-antitoxin system RelE/ParE family toxin [Coriobacteriia bacterium]MCL2871171.1 type II toxin-antitoxin system RelE/ParE family toxin [Coriobacteriia bacterium]